MNDRPRQTPEDTHPLRFDSDSAAHLSENKISKLLAECLEEARSLHPGSFTRQAVPLTPDPATDGPFTTVCKLATGTSATVYLAVDHRADAAERLVVVKHYLPAFSQSREFSARFTRELNLARAVNHPCVSRLFDFGRTRSSYYTATEFLQGEPLSSALATQALQSADNRSPRLLAYLIAELAEGLHALHTLKGVAKPVHGDVTSNHLFVLYDGQVRVTNFGTAWIHELSQKRAPIDKSYLSPEQVEGSVIDARTDIWALGVVLWELLTGKKLFRCTTNLEAVVEILAHQIPSPCADNPRVTVELERIVLKALARDPDERFRSAHELSLALEQFIAHSGGPVARTEVIAWLTRLFPSGADRCLGMLELAATVPTPLPHFADSFGSAPPVSYAYTPAAEDQVENTTQIYAPKVDEDTLHSVEWPAQSLRGTSSSLRRLQRDSEAWRSAATPFAAAFAIVLLGFFAGHATFSRARVASKSAAAPTFELERKHAPPVPATYALKPTADAPPVQAEIALPTATTQPASPPSVDAEAGETGAQHVDFDADEVDSKASPTASKIAAPREGSPTRSTAPSTPSNAPSATSKQPGDVYVTTPGGGDVYERGRYLGHAPGGFALSPGWHTILVKSGDEDRVTTIDVPAGAAMVVTLPAGHH